MELNHGPIAGGAKLLRFQKRPQLIPEAVLNAGGPDAGIVAVGGAVATQRRSIGRVDRLAR